MTASNLELFKAAVLQSWNGIVITDADAAASYRVQFANPAFCAMTGYSADELVGRTLKMLQGPDTDQAVIEHLRACLREERFFEGGTTNYRKDGTPYIVRWNISPVRDRNGVLTHFVSVQQDVTARVSAEQRSRVLEQAFEATSESVMVVDCGARIVFANRSFTGLSGFTLEELSGKTPLELGMETPEQGVSASLPKVLESGQLFLNRFLGRRRDGSTYHLEQSISPIRSGSDEITHFVVVCRDISEQVRREEALREVASRDKLTGLYNRHQGERLLEDGFKAAHASRRCMAVLMCDIDHFKRINDTFGHVAGDRILADVAAILRRSVRDSDAVIRWGGEEFLVVLGNCNQSPAFELAERIRARVGEYEDAEVGRVSISVGLASLMPDESLENLVARADAALYQSKHAGRNRTTVAR